MSGKLIKTGSITAADEWTIFHMMDGPSAPAPRALPLAGLSRPWDVAIATASSSFADLFGSPPTRLGARSDTSCKAMRKQRSLDDYPGDQPSAGKQSSSSSSCSCGSK